MVSFGKVGGCAGCFGVEAGAQGIEVLFGQAGEGERITPPFFSILHDVCRKFLSTLLLYLR